MKKLIIVLGNFTKETLFFQGDQEDMLYGVLLWLQIAMVLYTLISYAQAC